MGGGGGGDDTPKKCLSSSRESSGSIRNKRFDILGKWVNGGREGHGSILSPRLEKLGVKGIHGWYQEGILTGRGKLIMNDESVREGWFQHGYFHGPAR